VTKCNLCNEEGHDVIYDDQIRDGVVGKRTKIKHKVVKCKGCGLVRLLDNPLTMEYYQSDKYRNAYNETSDISDYIEVHDIEQMPRLNKIGVQAFRDKTILDHGCGGGAFLDLVSGIASTTIGIEPFTGYHESLTSRGHEVFGDSISAINSYEGKVDTIVSFGVLEHVEDPTQYLKDSFDLLANGGKMYLETDNLDDILMKLNISEFDQFFYRTAHLWYFNDKTLSKVVEDTGFTNIGISFRQNFDISNAMMWLRDGKPTGNGKFNIFDSRINAAWKQFVESAGLGDLVCVEMTKI
jgi:2-polyprenyl-3-methyl-5-hydroxy-6-metoxy-1,4-benzoquinol methylase